MPNICKVWINESFWSNNSLIALLLSSSKVLKRANAACLCSAVMLAMSSAAGKAISKACIVRLCSVAKLSLAYQRAASKPSSCVKQNSCSPANSPFLRRRQSLPTCTRSVLGVLGGCCAGGDNRISVVLGWLHVGAQGGVAGVLAGALACRCMGVGAGRKRCLSHSRNLVRAIKLLSETSLIIHSHK